MNNTKIVVDPIIQKFLDQLASKPSTPLYKLSPKDARKVLDDLQAINVPTLPVDIEERTIPVEPGEALKIYIYRPKGNLKVLPIIMYMHGGGWVLGNVATHDRLVREITHGTQAAVVFVEYTPAPEGQYPIAHEQGYGAAMWVHENASSLNLDNSRMAIAGDSVGGLMATAISMMAKEASNHIFIAQALLYPVTDANFDTPSYEEFAQGPWLTKAAMEWFWDTYVPRKSERLDPLVSPLRASLEQLKHLPQALIITNENDVLRDEGEAYAHKLMQADVPTIACRYIGTIHDCAMLNAITDTSAVRAMIEQVNKFLTNAFNKARKD